jgi:hypothetical protein
MSKRFTDNDEAMHTRRPRTALAVLLLATVMGCGDEDGTAGAPAEGGAPGGALGDDSGAMEALTPTQELARAAVALERGVLHERYLLPLPELDRSLEVTTWVDDQGDKQTVAVDLDTEEVVDLTRLKRAEAQALEKRCGKLDAPLCDDLAVQKATTLVPAMIWLVHPENDVDRALAETAPEQWKKELQRAVDARRAVAERVGKRLEKRLGRPALERSLLAPVLSGWLTRDEIVRVAADVEVGQVMLGGREVSNDLAASQTLSHWTPGPDADGTGVPVGVLETSRPDDVSQLGALDVRAPAGAADSHSRLVTAIIRNTSATPGYANAATVAIANRLDTDTDIADIDWAVITKGTDVHNQSWHFLHERTATAPSARDRYLDYITRAYAKFFATASSNADDRFVVHKGYNIVSVGATYNDGNIVNGASPAGECALPASYVSTWRNGGTQELPHVVADGGCVTAVGTTNAGTSFAAPAVTGMAAGLVEVAPILGGWPEPLKAILLASPAETDLQSPDTCAWRRARDGGGTCVLGDGRDGTGLVRGDRARTIAESPNTGGLQRDGFDYGFVNKASFLAGTNLLNETHYAKGQASCSIFLERLRVAVAWDSDATCTTGSSAGCSDNLDMDLDLLVYEMPGNSLIASSSTTTNSYEHIDVPIRPQFGMCTPAGENWYYRIEVRLANYATVGAAESTYYGLAWSVY